MLGDSELQNSVVLSLATIHSSKIFPEHLLGDRPFPGIRNIGSTEQNRQRLVDPQSSLSSRGKPTITGKHKSVIQVLPDCDKLVTI